MVIPRPLLEPSSLQANIFKNPGTSNIPLPQRQRPLRPLPNRLLRRRNYHHHDRHLPPWLQADSSIPRVHLHPNWAQLSERFLARGVSAVCNRARRGGGISLVEGIPLCRVIHETAADCGGT